jgi:nitric oxide reductase subunit C
MSAFFTKSMARNIFYGGTLFTLLLFLALTFHTIRQVPGRVPTETPSPEVARGKSLWETRSCIGCHTLLGEGAYFAPEPGNVYPRRGPAFIKAWIQAQPQGNRIKI